MTSQRVHVSRDDLVEVLERQILTGALAVGEALPSERRLAETAGVSRSVVREALRVLAERRLVNVETGRGTFVREADPSAVASAMTNSMRGRGVTARHVIAGRRLLEAETARVAAACRTAEDIADIAVALEAVTIGLPLLDLVRADLSFHLAVARAAHNPVLEAMFTSISGLAAEVMLRSLSDPAVVQAGLPGHRDIAAAIEQGDPEAAATHMSLHLDVATTHYGADLDRNLDVVAERRLQELVGSQRTIDDLFSMAANLEGTAPALPAAQERQ